jgi:hypothetical protein
MEDQSILKRIQHLVDEEHRLGGNPSGAPEDHQRHQEIRVELDQCWDLLRQRRAKREFDEDPDQAKVRAPEVVERYEQ